RSVPIKEVMPQPQPQGHCQTPGVCFCRAQRMLLSQFLALSTKRRARVLTGDTSKHPCRCWAVSFLFEQGDPRYELVPSCFSLFGGDSPFRDDLAEIAVARLIKPFLPLAGFLKVPSRKFFQVNRTEMAGMGRCFDEDLQRLPVAVKGQGVMQREMHM